MDIFVGRSCGFRRFLSFDFKGGFRKLVFFFEFFAWIFEVIRI